MLKKFVPLDDNVGPSQTPYNIKTYKGPAYEEVQRPINIDPCCYGPLKPCKIGKVPPPKTMTTEELIFRLFEIPHKPRPQKSCKKKCKSLTPYNTCVMDQRSPGTLKHHAIVREKYLKTKGDFELRIHDASEPSSEESSLIQMESPTALGTGRVKPRAASPACSLDTFYVPSRKLLDLKRQKSGVYVNETPRPVDSDIPFETYNPRRLQERIEAEQRKKYTLLSDGERFYFPWMQGGGDMGELGNQPRDENAIRQDCLYFKPVIFPIPNDLHKTFTAAVVFSNGALAPHMEDIGPQRPIEMACLYAAYVESFAKNPDYWSAKTMDSLLQYGILLCDRSCKNKYEDSKSDYDIIPELTEKEATIEMKLHLTGTLTDEPNILKALSLFFNKFNAGVLCCESLYFLVWKRCTNSFYIFDPNGRDVQCKRDFKNGKASLMAIQTVEHIVHLILNYSDIRSRSEFNLYEIHLKDFGRLSKPMHFEEKPAAKKVFAMVNRFYAVIPAVSGLPAISASKSSEDNASMMISFLAIVYSQINPPRQWSMMLVNDLIKFGKKYHGDYICDNRLRKLNVADLPDAVLFGNYRVLVQRLAFARSGHVVDCWSYRVSQLTLAIMDFFLDCNTGILQVDDTTFGIWREGNIFFVFDSFKRGPAGQAIQYSRSGAGCLQIHLNIDSLCRIMFMNAIAVKTEGNYFLHGIRVKAVGTFNVNRAKEDAATFGTLHIKYPFDCEQVKETDAELQVADCGATFKMDRVQCTLVQCLSELSVSPCERTCSEREFQQQQKKLAVKKKLAETPSIQSIPEEFRIPEFDNIDVVDAVVTDFICDIMARIDRKTNAKHRVCIAASKILLQSDKAHLRDLRLRLKRGEDYDNICAAFKTHPPVYKELTLEQELALDSNFGELLDGSFAIFGLSDVDIDSQPLRGILATITSAALSSKYKVSTWSSDVIEYALESSQRLEERFWSYNHTLDLIFRKQIPKLQLGSTRYQIQVLVNETVVPDKLKEVLERALLQAGKVFLICQGLSCYILRRYNFIYMFMGCPCDVVGFRSKSKGPMCLLRFIDFGPLVRRIQNACARCAKYVIVQIHVKDVTDPKPDKYALRTASQEAIVYGRELTEKERQKQRYKDKMKFIEHEIRKESARVKKFQEEKMRPPSKKKGKTISLTIPQKSSSRVTEEMEEGFFGTSEESIAYKHKPGKSLVDLEEELEMEDETVIMLQLGYQLKEQDLLFKIQGSTALEGRTEAFVDKIKTCYFASTVALLYAILRPLNHWDSQRIDKVITVGKNTAKKTSDFETASERIIKNIDVDEFTFDVKVQAFTPMGSFGGSLEYKISKTIQTQRYFMVQLSNTTFAVYHDDYFHLFDPYPSMELGGEDGGEEEQEKDSPEFIPKYPEQNTASWVLFGDLETMLQYIEKRAVSPNWKTEYQIHTVGIVSYKTAPRRVQLLNLLTDEFNTCPKANEILNLCTHPEEIEWLDIYPKLVIWSRLNSVNAVQRHRGSALTKDKNFDVEIPDKLYSLWGSIHPISAIFGESRGKQYLAINVVACCIANVYQFNEWSTQILDSIVINGNDYFNDSVATIKRTDYEISLEHLNTVFEMGHLHFEIHLESVTYGYLYARAKNELNLAAALTFFFTSHRYGIIQCMKRSVAIGKIENGFFMFDCQTHGLPLFHTGQGAAYVLRATHLQTLLYCVVMTLNLPYYNAQFTIHKVEMINEKINVENAPPREEEEDEEQ